MKVSLEQLFTDHPGDFSCTRLAALMGRHPNTLRKYEEWGFISPVPRAANNYRLYGRRHVLQALFAVKALRVGFQDWRGRRRIKAMINLFVEGELCRVSDLLRQHRQDLETLLAGAIRAKEVVTSWDSPEYGSQFETPLSRKAAAAEIQLSPDTLRDWERSGLISPFRDSLGHREYSPQDRRQLQIIRMLRQAGYSHMGILSLLHKKTAQEDLTFARDNWDQTLRGFLDDCDALEHLLAHMRDLVAETTVAGTTVAEPPVAESTDRHRVDFTPT